MESAHTRICRRLGRALRMRLGAEFPGSAAPIRRPTRLRSERENAQGRAARSGARRTCSSAGCEGRGAHVRNFSPQRASPWTCVNNCTRSSDADVETGLSLAGRSVTRLSAAVAYVESESTSLSAPTNLSRYRWCTSSQPRRSSRPPQSGEHKL
jgi:hypothetical protein